MQRKSRLDRTLFRHPTKIPTTRPANSAPPVRLAGGPSALLPCPSRLLLAALLAAAGCRGSTAPATPAAKPASLRVVCPDEVSAALVSRYGGRWASKAGARLQVARYAAEAGLPEGSSADVMLLPPADLPR